MNSNFIDFNNYTDIKTPKKILKSPFSSTFYNLILKMPNYPQTDFKSNIAYIFTTKLAD